MRLQRRLPTRLLRPWDSPGKNSGVGSHFLLQCMKAKSESEVAQSCPTLRNPMDCSLPGSSTYEIFQARVLEWGAIAFSERLAEFSSSFPAIRYLSGSVVKNSPAMQDTFWPLGWKNPLEKKMATHCSILAWEIPWTEEPGRLQSMGSLRVGHDWATSLSLFAFMHWRRNGNPLQCSCLENPRDGRAWWASIYGVAQSQTRLKRLSSSSSTC